MHQFLRSPALISIGVVMMGLIMTLPLASFSGPLAPPTQVGNLLRMTNANVRLDDDLTTGRANFYWKNSLKIAGFYAGVEAGTYFTGTVYTGRSWSVGSNQVEVTSTRADLPTMKQIFILDQDNSFLTRVEIQGTGLQSRWMGPVVMDTSGGVQIGTYSDVRALVVPFDNDSFDFSYTAQTINSTATSYEAGAFYDNTTRNGLVVGSVTHEQWKTGVYFQGSNSRLNVLNVFGGVTSADTRDVLPHGFVKGNVLASPTVYVGFSEDWRDAMEAYADANTAITPRLKWDGGVPFGWNSWYAYGSQIDYSRAAAASTFIKENLQDRNFSNKGVVYINLDSYWSNLSDAQLRQFVALCRSNGQKAGIYWTPFVYWGTAEQGTNTTMTGSSYKWSSAFLRTPEGKVQTIDSGIALDPTHPATRSIIDYYMAYFISRGFEYLKVDFLSHGALEGVHFDPAITTGIQAYNYGMAHLSAQNGGRMFLNASIAPLFPYQYCHSRRIACDTSTYITETAFQMRSVSYGWWINGRLYEYSDPDVVRLEGASSNENQSRLISCAISGTVFLNGDALGSTTGQSLAKAFLTNAAINHVARDGRTFRPVQGNTGTNPTDTFVRQQGATWYVAVFNYSSYPVIKPLVLSQLGISGTCQAVDLWSKERSTVSGSTWSIGLGAKQAKLFQLYSPAPASLSVALEQDGLRIAWPATHAGWTLQTRSNTSDTAVSEWLDMAGSQATNFASIHGNAFGKNGLFRLRSP